MDNLSHKDLGKKNNFSQIKKDVDGLVLRLDQKHYLERKIKFLLDIRGYIKVNNIRGSYVEFGSYKSEMQYAAFKILDETGYVDKYIGLDSFSAKVDILEDDKQHNLYEVPEDFLCDYDSVRKFIDEELVGKGFLVRGDFRKQETQSAFKEIDKKISIAVFDCNFISSTQAALELFLESAVPGCVLFFDDYFTNFQKGIPAIPDLVNDFFSAKKFKLIDLGFYPPFAKSFLLVERQL